MCSSRVTRKTRRPRRRCTSRATTPTSSLNFRCGFCQNLYIKVVAKYVLIFRNRQVLRDEIGTAMRNKKSRTECDTPVCHTLHSRIHMRQRLWQQFVSHQKTCTLGCQCGMPRGSEEEGDSSAACPAAIGIRDCKFFGTAAAYPAAFSSESARFCCDTDCCHNLCRM